MDPLTAYEKILKKYEIEEEIIITYEIQADKLGLTKNHDLRSEEIQALKDTLEEDLFNEFLKEI